MQEYINSLFDIFKFINQKAKKTNDQKLGLISLVIFNYIRDISIQHNIKLDHNKEIERINLIPIFQYINKKNIQLYDFDKMSIDDLDVNKKEDIERFVLTHVHYITQHL